jgi:hypothetical protein
VIDVFEIIWKEFTGFFKKKYALKAHFLDETGHQNGNGKTVKYNNNGFSIKRNGKEEHYLVRHERIIYDQGTGVAHSYYYAGNPEPILFKHTRNKEVDAIGFKQIIDSKAIEDLFKDESANLLMILLIMLVITMILVAIIGLKVFGYIKLGASP